jgi:hypothetical protein
MPSRAWVPLTAPRYVFVAGIETDRTSLSVGVLDTVAETGIAAAVPHPTSRRATSASRLGKSHGERESKANRDLIDHSFLGSICLSRLCRLPGSNTSDDLFRKVKLPLFIGKKGIDSNDGVTVERPIDMRIDFGDRSFVFDRRRNSGGLNQQKHQILLSTKQGVGHSNHLIHVRAVKKSLAL